MVGEVLAALFAIILFAGGFFGKWVWDYYAGRVVEADKRSNEALRERVDVIGGEIKSRLTSLETRFGEFERHLSEFKKETQFALRSQRDHSHDIYKGVEAVIKKADEINNASKDRIKVVEEKMDTFIGWLKKNGRS